MPARPRDTAIAAESAQIRLLRAAGPARRAALALSLSATTRDMAWRAIRRANPEASETDVALTFVSVHYGQELADGLRARIQPDGG